MGEDRDQLLTGGGGIARFARGQLRPVVEQAVAINQDAHQCHADSVVVARGGGNPFAGMCAIDFDHASPEFGAQVMPIYEYELCEGDCKVCGGKFTLNRPLSAKPLTNCPACKKPVRKVFSNFSSPQKLKPLSITDAKKAGFTVLKRLGKGEYERQ